MQPPCPPFADADFSKGVPLAGRPDRPRPLLSLVLRAIAVLSISLHVCDSVAQEPGREWAERINQANAALRAGDVPSALKGYEQATALNAQSDELNYNRAVALYRQGDLEAAQQLFDGVAKSADDALAAQARYNSGNSRFAAAVQLKDQDAPAAIRQLESAIQDYRSSLSIAPDTDARVNIELAAKLIDELQRRQQQQQAPQQSPDRQPQEPQQNDSAKEPDSQQSKSKDQEESQQSGPEQEKQRQQEEQQRQAKPDKQAQQDQKAQKGQPSNQGQQKEQDQDQAQGGNPDSQQAESKQQDQHQQEQNQQSSENSQQNGNSPKSQADGQQQTDKNQESPGDTSSGGSKEDRQREKRPPQRQKSARDSADSDTSSEVPPDAADSQPTEQQGPQQGELTVANPMDKPSGDQQQAAAMDDALESGPMTKDEAAKLLQAIRDRDMLRRLRRKSAERARHIPVDKDW